jgi:hypothetical protein
VLDFMFVINYHFDWYVICNGIPDGPLRPPFHSITRVLLYACWVIELFLLFKVGRDFSLCFVAAAVT